MTNQGQFNKDIQRKETWDKCEYYEENIKKQTRDVIVHTLLQISNNITCIHLDLDMDGIYGFQTFISPSWYTTARLLVTLLH